MASNKRINKAYVRYDGTGRVISGSLILNRFKPKVGNWSEIPAYECCNPVTTLALRLLFDDIANVPVGDAANISDWNTFFDLPTNGTPFTSVAVLGNEVQLFGGIGITIKTSLFDNNQNIISVIDSAGSVTTLNSGCFYSCYLLTAVNFPNVTTGQHECFYDSTSLTIINLPAIQTIDYSFLEGCTSLTTVYLPACVDLGGTVGDNNVFSNIIGNTITLTVPTALMTCDSGSPDGDIVYLQANNTVTVVTV